MIADQPVINYKKDKEKKATKKDMDALYDKWNAERGESMVGKTISLDDFMMK